MANADRKPLNARATIVSQLETLAKKKPEKPAYILYDKDFKRTVLTRQDVWDKSRKFAAILKRHGVTKGDIVCNTLVNSPGRIITCLGTLTAGAISMHGQVLRADGEDLINSLRDADCKVILLDSGDGNGASVVLNRIKYTDEKTKSNRYLGLPNLTEVIVIKTCGLPEAKSFNALIDKEKRYFVEENISPDDVAAIFHTSGTTGFSKLIQHTHFTAMDIGASCNWMLNDDTGDTIFNTQSMGWVGGFPFHYPRLGLTRVCIDMAAGAPEDLGSFLVNIFNQEDLRIGGMMTCDMHLMLAALKNGATLNRLCDFFVTGGAPIHHAVMDAVGKITEQLSTAYEASEFGLASYLVVKDKSEFQDMCVGRPYTSEIKIIGEDGTELPAGNIGDILVRTRRMFKGYINNPTKTNEAFTKDGWFITGDIGYYDADGQLFALGRKSDSINRNGFIHYTGWIEKLVLKIPGIEQNVLIGIPDPVHHEEMCLCMKLSPGADLTEEKAREHYKKFFVADETAATTPMPLHFLFFDDFIRNSNGKVDRTLMKKEVCKRLRIPCETNG